MRFTLIFILLITASPSLAQVANLLRRFDYEKKAGLDVKEIGVERRGDIALHDISYASPKGGRVPAYFVVPQGAGPFAAVIWGHWYWEKSPMRNRREFLDEAVALARSGVVSCPRSNRLSLGLPYVDSPDVVQSVRNVDPHPINLLSSCFLMSDLLGYEFRGYETRGRSNGATTETQLRDL